MNGIKKFWGSGVVGKIVIGCVSLLIFCCLCSIPVSIFSPSTPTPLASELMPILPTDSGTSTNTGTEVSPTKTDIVQPSEAVEPTETAKPVPSDTVTPLPL